MASFGDIGGIVGSALVGFVGGGAQSEYDDMIFKQKEAALAQRDQALASLQQQTHAANAAVDTAQVAPREKAKLQAQQDVENDPNNVQANIDRVNKVNTGTAASQAAVAGAKVGAETEAKDAAARADVKAKGSDKDYLAAVKSLAEASDKPGEANARNALAMYHTALAQGMPAENALRLAQAYKDIQGTDSEKSGASQVKVITGDDNVQYAYDPRTHALGRVVTDKKDPNYGSMQWKSSDGKVIDTTQPGQAPKMSDAASSARDAAVAAIGKAAGTPTPSKNAPASFAKPSASAIELLQSTMSGKDEAKKTKAKADFSAMFGNQALSDALNQ